MSIPNRPRITRLRWVSSKDPETIEAFVSGLGIRIQIYDLEYANNKWYLWFVPDDLKNDVRSGDLD